LLPEGSRSIPLRLRSGLILAGKGEGLRRMRPLLADVAVVDPLARGLFVIDDGRLPKVAGEVLASPVLLDSLNARIGDRVVLEGPGGSAVTVTGTGRWASNPRSPTLIGPGLLAGRRDQELGPLILVDLPPNRRFVAHDGLSSNDRTLARGADVATSDIALLYLLGGLTLAAFGLVVASALAVGARRQLRAIGLLGANGASPRQAARLMLLQGGVLGVVGAIAGLVGGISLWFLVRPLVERWSGSLIGPTVIRPWDLVVAGVLAVLVAVGAGILPARLAARTSVIQALGGRRPLSRIGRRFPVIGVVVSTLGCVVLAKAVSVDRGGDSTGQITGAVIGSALVIAGLVVCAPFLVGLLEPAAARLSGTARLAARTIARQRSRTGPTVAAVMATAALAIAAATVAVTIDRRDREQQEATFAPDVAEITVFDGQAGRPGMPPRFGCDRLSALAAPVRRLIPGSVTACVQSTDLGPGSIGVVTGPDLETLGLEDLRRGFESGTLILLGPGQGVRGPIQVRSGHGGVTTVDVVGSGVDTALRSRIGTLLASPETAKRLGAEVHAPTTLVLRSPAPLTATQGAELRALNDGRLDALISGSDEDISASIAFARQYESPISKLIYAVVLPASALLVLLTALIGLALASSETRDEQATFVAVGAGPSHRRRQNAWQAVIVMALGLFLAIPGGLVPAAIVLRVTRPGVAITLPWFVLAVVVIGLPLLAAVGAALFTRGRMSPLLRRAV
jgi:putative ABC transport system permease protein